MSTSHASQQAGSPAAKPPAPGAAALQALRRSAAGDGLKALFLGLSLTALLYEVFPVPFLGQTWLQEVLTGTLARAIVAVAAWAGFLALLKALRMRRQFHVARTLQQPAVLDLLRSPVLPQQVEGLLESLAGQMPWRERRWLPQSVHGQALQRTLAAFRARGAAGLANLVQAQSEAEAELAGAPYALLQALVWSLALLGLLGSLLGLAGAMQHLGDFIRSADAAAPLTAPVREALGGMAQGVAGAFDSMLLAVALATPLLLGLYLLRQAEAYLFSSARAYCLEQVVPHLQDPVTLTGAVTTPADPLERAALLANSWLAQLGRAVEQVRQQTDSLHAQLAGIQPLVHDFTQRMLQTPAEGPPGPRSAPGEQPAPGET